MIRPIQYEDYDKISDDILYLGSKLYVRMNVSLSTKDGIDRRHFHKEFNYGSQYASDDEGLISIRRSFNYYLTFDKTDVHKSIMIRPQDMIILIECLSKVSVWFKNGTFGSVDDEVVILKKRRPIIVSGLVQNAYLQFDPVVVEYEDPPVKIQGVQITLGDPLVYAHINVDNFFGLLYTLINFRMFESAQSMINYIGRPAYGFNMMEMNNKNPYARTQQTTTGNTKKKKGNAPEKNESFFS